MPHDLLWFLPREAGIHEILDLPQYLFADPTHQNRLRLRTLGDPSFNLSASGVVDRCAYESDGSIPALGEELDTAVIA